jgi:L-threonylcarbamoyladenylate synthase
VEIADFENWGAAAGEAARVLAAGEVVAVPTETVYGLAAVAFNPEAVARVFEVKERPSFDPLIVHLAGLRDLRRVAVVPEGIEGVVRQLAEAFWPGPLTLVLPKHEDVPDLVTSGLPTVAVRVSKHEVMRHLAKKLGPIAAPSANRFGRISPTSASAVMSELEGRIPLIIDGGACSVGLESTIVAVEAGEKRPTLRLLRPGPVTREELRKFGRVLKAGRVTDDRPEAPGTLESHYAPGVPVLLFDDPGEFEPEEGRNYALLSYRGDPRDGYLERHAWTRVEVLSPGKGKLAEAAVRFFFAMRALDTEGIDAIVAEPVSDVGLGSAIMDRLRRAAAKSS